MDGSSGLVEAMETYGMEEGLINTESEETEMKVNSINIRVKPAWKWLLNIN